MKRRFKMKFGVSLHFDLKPVETKEEAEKQVEDLVKLVKQISDIVEDVTPDDFQELDDE